MGLVSKYVLPAGLIIGVLIGGSQLIQYIERRGLDRFEQRLTQVASVCEYNSRDTFRSDFFTEHNLEDSDDGHIYHTDGHIVGSSQLVSLLSREEKECRE